jgi:hypothetical protein
MANRSSDQRIASWVFGSTLVLFALFLMVWGPESLPLWKQRLLGFLCALLSGLFSYFFIGTASFIPNKIPIRASGGVAVFLIVLWWWFSGLAPIQVTKITPRDFSTTIRITAIDEESEKALEQFNQLQGIDPVVSLRITTHTPLHDKVWSSQFTESSDESSAQLKSANITISEEKHPTVDGTTTTRVFRFNEFVGNLGKFDEKQKLSESSLVAMLASKSKNITLLNEVVGKYKNTSQAAFNSHYKFTGDEKSAWENSNSSLAPLPFRAEITIQVNGEPIWRSTGYLARIWEGDEDVRGVVAVFFPQSKIGSISSSKG